MSKETDRLDGLLADFTAARAWEDAGDLLAARVALGSASFSEKFRYHLGLGPSKKAIERTRQMNELRQQWTGFRSHV